MQTPSFTEDEKENLYAIQSYRLLIDVGHMYEKKLFIKLLLYDVQKIYLLTQVSEVKLYNII